MKAQEKRLWNIFVRYLARECSEREAAEAEAYIAVDEEKGQFFDDLRELWEGAARPPKQLDVETAWEKLDSKIQQDAKVKSLVLRPALRPAEDTRRLRSAPRPAFYLAAASIAIAILAGILTFQIRTGHDSATASQEAKVFATEKGQQATIQLTDGTRVRLNADSRLTILSELTSKTREVRLDGQAFFDVARDEARPFMVHVALGTVQVLGTEFDVDAYPEMDHVQVVVKEGKVSVRSGELASIDTMVLRQGDLGLLMKDGQHVAHRNIDTVRYLGWTEGQLVFENAPFVEVARQLERWYDLQIELTRPLGSVDGLTATFTNEPLDEILSAISTALNLRYKRDGDKIFFFQATQPVAS